MCHHMNNKYEEFKDLLIEKQKLREKLFEKPLEHNKNVFMYVHSAKIN